MPKVQSASTARSKGAKGVKEDKVKREPSLYNLFVASHIPAFKQANPTKSHKEAFTEVAAMWRDSAENPNRGKPVKSRKKKAISDALPTSSSPAPSSSQSAIPSSDF